MGRTLDFAVKEAQENGQPLYVLFVREQTVIAPGDRRKKWTEDKQAREVFESLRDKGLGQTIIPCYAVSDAPAHTIADLASTIGAERVLLGAPQRSALIHILRGNIIREVARLLPDDITLLVCV
jgi:nucleotide-binding universal stress UspA family protein